MANANDKDDSLDLSDDLLYEYASHLDDEFHVHIQQENEAPPPPIDEITIDENVDIEEQHLSQQLSQLSASEHEVQSMILIKKRSPCTSPIQSTVSKTIKIDKEETKSTTETNIPPYLFIANKAFNQLIQSMLTNTTHAFHIEDVREMALLIHRIAICDLQQTLWTAYLRSGNGTIERHQPGNIHLNLSLWPTAVKSMMLKSRPTTATVTNISQMDEHHEACFNYVSRTLRQFIDRKIEYQAQFEENKSRRFHKFFTSDMEYALTQFIEQQEMIFIRLEMASKIAIVKYDYNDRLLELEFQQWQPIDNQLQLFRHAIKIKEEKEQSQYEVALLKQRLVYNYLPDSLETLQLPLPSSASSIATIKDTKTRQDLLDRYTKILHQTKSQMMSLYVAIAEIQRHECQLKFDKDIPKTMRPDERLTTKYLRLSETMIDILERRFKNIDERLEYLYNLKIRFLEKKSFHRHHHHHHV